MMSERKYTLRYRLRDGQDRVWEIDPKTYRLSDAQDVADKLWDQGYETSVAATDYSN